MDNIKIELAVDFKEGMPIFEKVGEQYDVGTIYSEDGDNLHVFLIGTGRKTIAKANAYQVFITINGVDYVYKDSVEYMKQTVEYLGLVKPTLDITGEETKEEKEQKLKDYSDALYPYLEKQKNVTQHQFKISGDIVEIDKSALFDYKQIGMLSENIGRQHITLEKKGQLMVQSLGLKGYKVERF